MKDRRLFWTLGVSLFLAVLGQCFITQRGLSWTLAPGLAFYLAAVLLFVWPPPVHVREGPLSPGTEFGWLFGIGGLVLFFRLYRILEIPPGMTLEETCGSWLGLAVPLSRWNYYFFPSPFLATYPDIPCWAFGWFHLFPATHLSFSLFYAFLSFLSFPLGYLLFRSLAGPRTALGALFFWGIMPWHAGLGRQAHPAITSLFYVLGAVTFAHFAWQRGKRVFWILAGLFGGLGFYAYPSFRACLPLLLLFFFIEFGSRSRPRFFPLAGILLFFGIFLAVSGPGWMAMWRQQSWVTGNGQESHFVGRQMMEEKSLLPLARNLSLNLPAFHREGSFSAQENLPGRRLLDDVTGILLILGFFLSLWRWRERKYFYGVAGVAVLSFPCLLSDQPLHTSRMLGVAPFVAYMAALAAVEIWERTFSSPVGRRVVLALGVLATVAAVSENFKTYFVDRPQNEACWREAGAAPMKTGEAVADLGGAYEYYLSPVFWGQYTVLFLGHSQDVHLHPLDLPASFRFLAPPPGRGLFFALQEGRTGVLAILQKLYPGGVTEKRVDPWGRPYLYFFRVPAEACTPAKFVPLDFRHSWRGTYWASDSEGARPVLRQSDPVLNFSYRDDFPVKNAPRLRARWSGTLRPKKAGLYHFLMAASDHTKAELEIGGKKVATLANQEAAVPLAPRDYQVVIRYQREGGFENAFHLVWKPPGSDRYEVLPPEALK